MAGLGLLLGLGVKLGADIAYGISDMQYRSTPCGTTQNGEPYYMGRDGKRYAANGERMVLRTAIDAQGNRYNRTVGERTGKVYFDKEKTFQDKADKENERERKWAVENGYLAYGYFDRSLKFGGMLKKVTKEIATGRYIAAIEYDPSKKECRKFYLVSNPLYTFQKIEGDKGVLITKEEFMKLNFWVCGGGHQVYGEKEFRRDRDNKLI